MNNCPDISILQDLLDNSCGDAERCIINEHIKGCTDCRHSLNQLKILDWDLAHLSIPQPDQADLDRVRLAAEERIAGELDADQLGSMGAADIYNVSLGNLKYAAYYTNFLPVTRWVEKGTTRIIGKNQVLSLLLRKGAK